MAKRNRISVNFSNNNVKNVPRQQRQPPLTKDEAELFEWIKKRAKKGKAHFDEFETKCQYHEPRYDAESLIDRFDISFVGIYIGKRGEKVIKIWNRPWINEWAKFYDEDIPHHKHHKPWKS